MNYGNDKERRRARMKKKDEKRLGKGRQSHNGNSHMNGRREAKDLLRQVVGVQQVTL